MNIDELKLVLETLQHTADGAKDFGIWWVAFHYGSQILDMVLWVLCIWGIAWGAVKAIMVTSGSSDSEQRLRQLRDILRVGSPGAVSPREFQEMRDKIRDFMKDNQQ